MYSDSGKLVKKKIVFADENEMVYHYTNDEDSSSVSLSSFGSNMSASFIATSTTDPLGRKEKDTLDTITKSYTYTSGKATQEHEDKAKTRTKNFFIVYTPFIIFSIAQRGLFDKRGIVNELTFQLCQKKRQKP